MRFGIVELSMGMVTQTGRNWNRLREEVEESTTGRWDNPVLVVLPGKWRAPHEEGEIPSEYVEENVVAVPQSGWGYGAEYVGFVNRNRRKFGLSEEFEPSEETRDVIGFRQKLSSVPITDALELLSTSSTELSQPGERSVEYKRLEHELDLEKEREEREIPGWASDVLKDMQKEESKGGELDEDEPSRDVLTDLNKYSKWQRDQRRLMRKYLGGKE